MVLPRNQSQNLLSDWRIIEEGSGGEGLRALTSRLLGINVVKWTRHTGLGIRSCSILSLVCPHPQFTLPEPRLLDTLSPADPLKSLPVLARPSQGRI